MELYKPIILFLLIFFSVLYYRKIKKFCILLFIILRRIKIKSNKISDINNENKIENNRDGSHVPHDYSSEEDMPPSPVLSSKSFKKD